MAKYRKKNFVDAFKFEGYINSDMPLWVAKAFDSSDLFRDGEGKLYVFVSVDHISKECPKGSWIVSDGGKLNIYNQKEFERVYELVGENEIAQVVSDINKIINKPTHERSMT